LSQTTNIGILSFQKQGFHQLCFFGYHGDIMGLQHKQLLYNMGLCKEIGYTDSLSVYHNFPPSIAILGITNFRPTQMRENHGESTCQIVQL
jgi:hypothetical protein